MPFKPGVSGNPLGRPKGQRLHDDIRIVMAQQFPGDMEKRTYAQIFALTLVELAMKGHPQAIKEVCGRYAGAIPQVIDVTDRRDLPMIQVSWVDPKPEAVNGNGTGSVSPSLPPANGTS